MNKHGRLLIIFISAIALLSFSSVAIAEVTYSKVLCKTSGYTCFKAKRHDSWESLWPNAQQRKVVMQVNRTNVPLYKNRIVAVPENLKTADYLDLAPFKRQIESPGEKTLIFDPSADAWAAYNAEGALVRWGAASGGASWCDDIQRSCRTPVGTFRVYHKGDEDCISTKYPLPEGGAHMPYCMFFHGGFALHGSPGAVMGYNASHGCTRLFVNDAQWLNREFVELPNSKNNYQGTKVIVRPYSSDEPAIKEASVKQAVVRVEHDEPSPVVETSAAEEPSHLPPREGNLDAVGETTTEELAPQ